MPQLPAWSRFRPSFPQPLPPSPRRNVNIPVRLMEFAKVRLRPTPATLVNIVSVDCVNSFSLQMAVEHRVRRVEAVTAALVIQRARHVAAPQVFANKDLTAAGHALHRIRVRRVVPAPSATKACVAVRLKL